MYEELSPRSNCRGLYDGLAKALGEFLHENKALYENGSHLQLIEAIIIVLRRENAKFNEARFRKEIAKIRSQPCAHTTKSHTIK